MLQGAEAMGKIEHVLSLCTSLDAKGSCAEFWATLMLRKGRVVVKRITTGAAGVLLCRSMQPTQRWGL
jgi:hypothetical protein